MNSKVLSCNTSTLSAIAIVQAISTEVSALSIISSGSCDNTQITVEVNSTASSQILSVEQPLENSCTLSTR